MRAPVLAAVLLALCSCSGSERASAPEGEGGGPPAFPKPVTVSARPDASVREKLYLEHCAMCHGPGGMGQGLLARRMDQPDLEKRADLTAEYVIAAVRTGMGNMPPVTRGELSDEQLEEIAQYLEAGPHGEGDGA